MYTPPKSVRLIRRMLRRIRHWVRWGVTIAGRLVAERQLSHDAQL